MLMRTLREWGFPVGLIVAWMVAAAYTVSLLIGEPEQAKPPTADAPAVAESKLPAS
jgi:hypothetical protein